MSDEILDRLLNVCNRIKATAESAKQVNYDVSEEDLTGNGFGRFFSINICETANLNHYGTFIVLSVCSKNIFRVITKKYFWLSFSKPPVISPSLSLFIPTSVERVKSFKNSKK